MQGPGHGGGDGRARCGGEQGDGLVHVKHEVVGADLAQLAASPPAAQRQRWVGPGGEHQVQAGWQLLDQRRQCRPCRRVGHDVDILDHDDDGPVDVEGEVVHQRADGRGRIGSGHGEVLGGLGGGGGLYGVDRDGDGPRQGGGVVVALAQGAPGPPDGGRQTLDPGAHGCRLAGARGPDHQAEAAAGTGLELGVEAPAVDEHRRQGGRDGAERSHARPTPRPGPRRHLLGHFGEPEPGLAVRESVLTRSRVGLRRSP